MNTFEVHYTPDRFEALNRRDQTAIHTDFSIRVTPGNHVIAQEYRDKTGEFTGRWIRYQVTHVERTSDHRQILSLREIARNQPLRSISRRAA